MNKSLLIWTCGDKTNGMGHVQRQLVLASSLLSRGIRIGFETPPDTPGHKRILDWAKSQPVSINDYTTLYDSVLIDVENGPSRQTLQQARQKFRRVIVVGGVGFPIYDQAAVDELVDLQIYQSIAVNDHGRSTSRSLVGVEYLIIHPEYLELREVYGRAVMGQDVCVVMGGADPHGLTDVFCEAAKISYGTSVRAVLGPAVDLSRRRMLINGRIRPFYAPPNLIRAFAGSRCLISALGMTTYEAMCVGLPVASVNWSEDHEATAKKLEQRGVTVNLGLWSNPDWRRMDEFICGMKDINCWQEYSARGRELVDGRGVSRVTEEIERLI